MGDIVTSDVVGDNRGRTRKVIFFEVLERGTEKLVGRILLTGNGCCTRKYNVLSIDIIIPNSSISEKAKTRNVVVTGNR